MLIRLRDLTSLTVAGDDGADHGVVDILLARADQTATHVVTRLGGWFAKQGCAVRIDAFGTPDLSTGRWPTALSKADAEAPGSDGPVAVLCAPDTLPDAADVAAAEGTGPLVRASDMDRMAVVGSDGQKAGSVIDPVIDIGAHRVEMLVLRDPAGAHQRVVPSKAVARIDWDAKTIHLTCEAATAADAPDLHEVGNRIEGHWYNRVMAYYGFG
ncbi:PRC-barrel domain-containing protein [Jannaschia donghaensis]|uniref:PRC-barrel domain protein n=1 Tax=Jannaschia donghaensis TaxID=420998 RepID=A0A0M6YII8_9RHOB|nr:PRC-barrel domain-containing protein [Jannaschia donghaensis]CTQ49770.1 PRC-barrel domain protein [Jannaschia donghaensis]